MEYSVETNKNIFSSLSASRPATQFIDSARNTTQSVLRIVWRKVKTMNAVYRERQALAALTPEQLADIGIHRGDAMAECRRKLLDIPKGR